MADITPRDIEKIDETMSVLIRFQETGLRGHHRRALTERVERPFMSAIWKTRDDVQEDLGPTHQVHTGAEGLETQRLNIGFWPERAIGNITHDGHAKPVE